MPRFLAYWLFLNGIAYVIQSLTGILLPRYEDTVATALSPAIFGEVAFILWLVIKGTKPASLETTSTAHLP